VSQHDVVVLVGSLREASYNRRIALALARLAPSALLLEIVGIGALPFYNEDLETAEPPAAWTAFRDRVRRADAVLFVTPEYNRSVPGVLKNAIDVGSRPSGRGVWSGRPAAVVSSSLGLIGGFGANQHLRQSLAAVGMPVLVSPEVYLSSVGKLFDEAGELQAGTAEFLGKFAQAFATWIDRNHR
jgi:chromate reductase, NAD(P)H dehydrogenase (quinone)